MKTETKPTHTPGPCGCELKVGTLPCNLHAAAPELLEALRAIRLELEYDLPRPAAKKMWAKADKAIAQAEGS